MSIPQYLTEPQLTGRIYGTVTFDPKSESYIIEAEPAVLEMCKRVFPGCRTINKEQVRFPGTRRLVGELNWLMLRYPLRIINAERFMEDRQQAIDHALRRDRNHVVAPTVTPPTFLGSLFPYQAEAVAFLMANERALLADDMGLGKTVSALGALATTSAFPVLLVVPTNVQRQWQRQAGVFLDLPIHGQQTLDLDSLDRGQRLCHIIKGRKPYDLPWVPIYITHYGLINDWREALTDLNLKAVVFDEIQELRHTGTGKYSAASLISGAARYVWGLSGTPIYNYGKEIWAVLNIIDYHCLGDEESFTREWCIGYGAEQVSKPDVLGDYLRREGLMIRRRKAEVQHQLPPKRRVVHVVNKDDSKYAALIDEAIQLAKGYDDIKDWAQRGQTKRLIEGAARKAAGVAKAPYVADFVRTLLDAGERVLLYAYHHDVHDILADELIPYRPVRITGKETPKEKDESIGAFADGKTNLIQLSLRATAGLDRLQGRGSCVVFAELDWSPAIHTQGEDRVHRIGVDGSLESILCYYMVSDTGMDETMQEALGLKIGQFVGIMGDTGESEEDRALAAQAAERHLDRVIQQLKQMKGNGGKPDAH